MKTFSGKIALVTGSTRGIGKAIARELSVRGATVLRSGAKKSKNAQNTKIYYADIRNPREVFVMVSSIKKDYGRLDILINNAGVERSNPFLKMENDEWEDVINVNVNGTFYVTKACMPLLLLSKEAKIINISSVYGLIGEYGLTNYCASKAAIIGFTKALAKELAINNITVNAVCPGIMDTGMMHSIPKKKLQKKLQQIPLGKLGKKEDVAKLVAFLCSEDASYITGQAINVSGGMY